MAREQTEAQERITVSLEAQHTLAEHVTIDDIFTVECYHADGHLIWRQETARAVGDVDARHLRITQP
jgi:hypothetical protein